MEQKYDDFPFVVGSDRVVAMGALADDTSPDSVDEGDIGIVRMSTARQLRVVVDDMTPGTDATDLGKAEDAVHASGDTGIMLLGVRRDTAAALGADGDYVPLIVDSSGRLYIAPLPANSGVDVGDVTLNASEAHVGEVGGSKARISTEVTRPADTTAYTAKDAVANATSGATVWTFTGVGRKISGSGLIVAAMILTDQTTNTESFRLHLFNTASTALQDNAACTAPLYADVGKYIGPVDFPACKTEGTGSTAAYAVATPNGSGTNLPLAYVCNATDTNLRGILETPTGFTPASGQKITIILMADND